MSFAKFLKIGRFYLSPVFLIFMASLLIACANPTPAKSPVSSPPNPETTISSSKGQVLPISAIAILPNRNRIELEVARTRQQKAMGLMYRPPLPDNRGMLFEFSPAQAVGFWMKNVPVPLDMIFLYKGEIKYIAPSVPPCKTEPCPTYSPNTLIDQVIELRSGRAAELNLKAGDRIKVENIPSK